MNCQVSALSFSLWCTMLRCGLLCYRLLRGELEVYGSLSFFKSIHTALSPPLRLSLFLATSFPFNNLPFPHVHTCKHTYWRATIMYRVCLVCGGGHMFSLQLKFLLSCFCSKLRGELGPIVARLPERRGWGVRERREMDGRQERREINSNRGPFYCHRD